MDAFPAAALLAGFSKHSNCKIKALMGRTGRAAGGTNERNKRVAS